MSTMVAAAAAKIVVVGAAVGVVVASDGFVIAYLYSITMDIEPSSDLFAYKKHTHQEKPSSSIYSNYFPGVFEGLQKQME